MMNDGQSLPSEFKSGFVAIVGAPNAGKSTLLNRLLGEKISITSRKPQTTRNRIAGVLTLPDAQLIFIDTPGIFRAAGPLNTRIVEAAMRSIGDADLILAVADAAFPNPDAEEVLVRSLGSKTIPVFLALNKIDAVEKRHLLEQIQIWSRRRPFCEILPVSARTGEQTEPLVKALAAALPAGPPLFSPDTLTDQPERFLVAEMVREKVFRLTGQEIPYACAVTVNAFKRRPDRPLIHIDASIHVERDSQKGIIIGRKGDMLRRIGESARRDIESLVGTRVFLKLHVRVQKRWRKDPKALRKFGL